MVVLFSVCFFVVFLDVFGRLFDLILGSFLHIFRIRLRAEFLLTFSSDVFQIYVQIQTSGSSKNTVFLE